MTEPPGDAPVVEQPVEPAFVSDPYHCYRCRSPHDPFQEYCLECGARLVPLGGGSVWRRDSWTRDSPLWFWATLLALLLIALVTGAIVLAATDDDGGKAKRQTTGQAALPTSTIGSLSVPTTGTTLPPTLTIAPTTGTGTTPIPTFPTPTTTPTFPTTTSGTTTVTTTGTTTGTRTVIAWPANRDGYTVILKSLPQSRGKAAAEAEARRAIGKGLRQVGVLNSSLYSTLNAGYWVVFNGIHDTESQANAGLPAARAAAYTTAYVQRVEE